MSASPPHTECDFLSSAHGRLRPQYALAAEDQKMARSRALKPLLGNRAQGSKPLAPPLPGTGCDVSTSASSSDPALRLGVALDVISTRLTVPICRAPSLTSSLGAFPPLWCSSSGRARFSLFARECSFFHALCRHVSSRLLSANPRARDPTGSASRNRARVHAQSEQEGSVSGVCS